MNKHWKNFAKTLALSAAFMVLLPLTAFADFGPKPNVSIKLENPPRQEYYVDLLYLKDSERQGGYPVNDIDAYNEEMVDLLFSYADSGWYPAYAGGGTYAPVFGRISPGADGCVHFSYTGVPDNFKIIVVTADKTVKVSQEINCNAISSMINLDYETMQVKKRPSVLVYPVQFAFTCRITLIVEGIVLILFGFAGKNNLKVFLLANLATQLVFTALFSTAYIFGSWMGCMMAFPFLEIAVTVAEAVIYNKKFEKNIGKKAVAYAVCANIFSTALTAVSFDKLFVLMGLALEMLF